MRVIWDDVLLQLLPYSLAGTAGVGRGLAFRRHIGAFSIPVRLCGWGCKSTVCATYLVKMYRHHLSPWETSR